jgi:hypothetical protein
MLPVFRWKGPAPRARQRTLTCPLGQWAIDIASRMMGSNSGDPDVANHQTLPAQLSDALIDITKRGRLTT